MIVKIFDSGVSHGESPINYLLGSDRERKKSELISGNPDLILKLINSSKFKKKYTSGVLSFQEPGISNEKILEVIHDFENFIFPSVSRSEYSFLWVSHSDKENERVELHFIIPNLNTLTGKRVQPYYYIRDFYAVNCWRTKINIEYNFSDPDDPIRHKNYKNKQHLHRSSEDIVLGIESMIAFKISEGHIKNRDDVVHILTEQGYFICYKNPDYLVISLFDGVCERKNLTKFKLESAPFKENFNYKESSNDFINFLRIKFAKTRLDRLERCHKYLKSYLDKKSAYFMLRNPSYINRLVPLDKYADVFNTLEVSNPRSNEINFGVSGNENIRDILAEANRVIRRAKSELDQAAEFSRKLAAYNSATREHASRRIESIRDSQSRNQELLKEYGKSLASLHEENSELTEKFAAHSGEIYERFKSINLIRRGDELYEKNLDWRPQEPSATPDI